MNVRSFLFSFSTPAGAGKEHGVSKVAYILVLAGVGVFTANSSAITFQQIYSTDFSSDPGWDTNNPSRYYTTSDGTYYVNQVNKDNGGFYSLYDASRVLGSWQVQYDIKIASSVYASGLSFGMYGTDPESDSHGSYARVIFTTEQRGRTILMGTEGVDDVSKSDWDAHRPRWSFDTWYRVTMTYDSSVSFLTADVDLRDEGTHLGILSISGAGPYSSDMDRLGNSNYRGHSGFQVPGYKSIGQIDNVSLSIPEPATLSMLGFGSIIALRRSRRHKK